ASRKIQRVPIVLEKTWCRPLAKDRVARIELFANPQRRPRCIYRDDLHSELREASRGPARSGPEIHHGHARHKSQACEHLPEADHQLRSLVDVPKRLGEQIVYIRQPAKIFFRLAVEGVDRHPGAQLANIDETRLPGSRRSHRTNPSWRRATAESSPQSLEHAALRCRI